VSDDFWGHIDARIEQKCDVVLDATGEVIGRERRDFQAALDRRDAEIALLRREVGALRSEIELKLKLKRELAAARAEVEELRQRAPSYESELNGLREELAKQQKLVTRLRGAQSILEYRQEKLSTEQEKNRAQVSLTAVQVTTFGEQTRAVLARLREEGFDFDFVGEMHPLSRLAS
jgi:chromosome segregation ATPase